MKRFRLTLEYDGTDFSGWGVQPDQRTVQGELGRCLDQVFQQHGELTAAGRTDAGVHARGQTVHADIPAPSGAEVLKRLNAVLPKDMRCRQAVEAADDFHARYHCLGKKYEYVVANTQVAPVFERRYCLWEPKKLTLSHMREAASQLEGEHDFSAFMNVGREVESAVRRLVKFKISRKNNILTFAVWGNGFLYNQVRIMVGTLLEVGRQKRQPDSMASLLERRQRQDAGPTAPPLGLFLSQTVYEGDRDGYRFK